MSKLLKPENIVSNEDLENTKILNNTITSELDVDPRARIKATLSPEKYALLENISKKLKVPMPNDEQFSTYQDNKYPLKREYLKDDEGNFILTEEEDFLLSKYDYSITPEYSEDELNKTIIETRMFDNLPLEIKENIAQTFKTMIDENYCNPEDEKNKPKNNGLSTTDMIISGIISIVATPAAGILYGSAKSAYNEQNQCNSTIEVIANTTLGGIKGAAYNAVPIVGGLAIGQVESVYTDSVNKMENERKNKRIEDIASGKEIMTEKEFLHNISTSINSLHKVVSSDRKEHDIHLKDIAYQKETQQIEHDYEEDIKKSEDNIQTSPETVQISSQSVLHTPVKDIPYVQPIGNLNLGYQNITVEKISSLQSDFEKFQNQDNTKRKNLSM